MISLSLRPFGSSDSAAWSECVSLCQQRAIASIQKIILVNLQTQSLHFFDQERLLNSYPISSGVNGIGQEAGSGKTPLGLHLIKEKIGSGADPFSIFQSRINTGRLAIANDPKAWITSRILRLQGLEPGHNLGTNADGICVDSFERYIYIHGTNDLANLGKPASEGCIRMHPEDIINLFEQVSEGTPVYMYNS